MWNELQGWAIAALKIGGSEEKKNPGKEDKEDMMTQEKIEKFYLLKARWWKTSRKE